MAIRKPHHHQPNHQSNTDQRPEVEVVAISLDPFIDPAAEAQYEASQRAQERRERETLTLLTQALDEVHCEIAAANTRAVRLLALFSAALAGALVLAATRSSSASTFSEVLLTLAVCPLLGSVAALLAVLYAPMSGDYGFPRWARYRNQPDALADYLTLPGDQGVHHCSVQLAAFAALAVCKYRRINTAVVLLVAGLVLLAAAALTT